MDADPYNILKCILFSVPIIGFLVFGLYFFSLLIIDCKKLNKIDEFIWIKRFDCCASCGFLFIISIAGLTYVLNTVNLYSWAFWLICVGGAIVLGLFPLLFAYNYSEKIISFNKSVIKTCYFACLPIVGIATYINNTLEKRRVRIAKGLSIEDLSTVLGMANDKANENDGESEESKILKGMIKFSEIEVSDIMKPRVDIDSIAANVSFDELIGIIKESGYSRFPVYDEDLDHIIGVLHMKDLLPKLHKNSSNIDWISVIRPAIFVPETQKIDQLLKEFKQKKVHLAIVVNEYGGTSGLITMEDILEEVVGDINDEFDSAEEDILYQKIDEYTYLFDAHMPIHDFCRLLDLRDDFFQDYEGEFETLAGLILEKLGRFPEKNEIVDFEMFSFSVNELDNKRIKTLKMQINK